MTYRATPPRARRLHAPWVRAGAAAVALAVAGMVASSSAFAAPAHHGHWGVVPVRSGATNSLLSHGATLRPHVGPKTLSYGGGGPNSGTGAVTGAPHVYLVVWGDWGTQVTKRGVGGAPYDMFSKDTSGEVPLLEAYFSGLGTNNDGWSGILSQYCESTTATTEPIDATACLPGTAPVATVSNGDFAGTVIDTPANPLPDATITPAPNAATASQLAIEAQDAANSVGDVSRNAVYVVLGAPGSHPDQFNAGGNFCGWHDDTYDTAAHIVVPGSTTGRPSPDVAFINMPYVTDAGFACGAHAVNQQGSGLADGVTIVAGHEYAEWLTDPFPGSGWSNASTGNEIGDECMWIGQGQQGAMVNLALNTGSFAVQSLWSNSAEACVTRVGSAIRVSPLRQIASLQSTSVSLNVRANSPDVTRRLVFSATGLPGGITINPSTGRVSGRLTGRIGLYHPQFTVTDTAGAPTTQVITWVVSSPIRFGPANVVTTGTRQQVRVRIHARDLIGHRSIHYVASGLPGGLTINPRTGLVTGSVTARAGTYRVRVTAIDSAGATARQYFVWRVR
jgi:hypothetical protein